jgi:hypothetical protein
MEVKNIIKPSELEKYLNSKSIFIIYWDQIKGTAIDKEMSPKDFLILYEEKEIDDEIDIDVHPEIWLVSRIEYYLYKDTDWDILYFRNPYYEWDVLDCMEYEYKVVQHRWEYLENDWILVERPEYNAKLKEKLEEMWYNHLEMTFKSEEFEEQIVWLVKLISSIWGQTIIKGKENL